LIRLRTQTLTVALDISSPYNGKAMARTTAEAANKTDLGRRYELGIAFDFEDGVLVYATVKKASIRNLHIQPE
jgi:hypothetical protein